MDDLHDPKSDMNKRMAREYHNRGIELTPTQIVDARRSVLAKARNTLRSEGIHDDLTDVELILYLNMAMEEQEE